MSRVRRVAGNADHALRLRVEGLEVGVRDRPVDTEAGARLQPEVLRLEAVRPAVPVEGRASTDLEDAILEGVLVGADVAVLGGRDPQPCEGIAPGLRVV